MNYRKRDKIISIRVSSELLQKAQRIIDNYTTTYNGRGNKKNYYTRLPNKGGSWKKYSIADLLEDALKKFIEETPKHPPGAK